MTTTTAYQPGDILTWNPQSDWFCGQYRLIEERGRGTWLAARELPSDELIEAARVYYLESRDPDLDWVDPFGPGRRRATRQESFDMEILSRIARAGETFEVRLVSAEQFYAAF